MSDTERIRQLETHLLKLADLMNRMADNHHAVLEMVKQLTDLVDRLTKVVENMQKRGSGSGYEPESWFKIFPQGSFSSSPYAFTGRISRGSWETPQG
jgi:prophage DNA circulation protein